MEQWTTKPILELKPGLIAMPPGWGESTPNHPAPINAFVQGWMNALDETGIPWAILRGADGLPSYTRYDIDLLIHPHDRERVVQLIMHAGTQEGWLLRGSIRKAYYTCLMFVRNDGSQTYFLPIDLFTALEHRGLHYFDVSKALAQRVRNEQSVWMLPPQLNAAITLLKEWLPHGQVKANSHQAVRDNLEKDRDGLLSRLAEAVGHDLATQLVKQIDRNEWKLTARMHRALRTALRRRSPSWMAGYGLSIWHNLRHLARPSLSAVVALAGADGSGKSTLAEGIMLARYRRPFKACRYVHGNIGVLPRFRDIRARIGRMLGRKPQVIAEPDSRLKGMMTPLPAWRSMALSAYYAFDLLLARFRLRRWRGQWSLIVMDRSFYDYYYQLGHRNCPRWWLDFLAIWIPKPDLLFFTIGSPGAIHARKPELTEEEIEREQAVLGEMTKQWPFAGTVDGTLGVESTIQQAVEALDREVLHDDDH